MKLGLNTATILTLWLALFANGAVAQTLTEKLIADDHLKLAEEARAVGNIVRGAILFHQGNINCAKCHRPSAEKDRLGPDLSRMEPDVTDAHLIESILQPSKTIKKGFETTIIQGVDGRVISGVMLSEDPQQIVIRDNKNIDQTLTLRREDIEEIKPGTLSSMPENLANELKDRQQFLDLLRYVIDVKERGPELSDTQSIATRRELAPELKGLVLLQELNCITCHGSQNFSAIVQAKQAPRLKWSAKWLNPRWMEQFIRDPHLVKPGTTMPELLLQEPQSEQAANAITHFLVSQSENSFAVEASDPGSAVRGHELFNSVGCVACHSPRNEQAVEQPLANSKSLGELSAKFNVSGLVEFLENPLAVRPSGHMPNMRLTHREATDIANFLVRSPGETSTPWKLDLELAKQGEFLFSKNNCQACHTDVIAEMKKGSDPLEAKSVKSLFPQLDQLRPDRGCLSGAAGNWPNFQLREDERQFIQAALSSLNTELTAEQKIDVTLYAFNCLACHDRNHLGGVTADRNPHFQTTNLNLGEQGRIPPTLTGVGAKLKPKWMREVLVTGRTIRPYMKTRMPQYGEENVGHLVEMFQSLDQLPETNFAKFENQEQTRKKGLELAGTNGLNCVSCHTYQYKLSDTMPAVDLTEMAERLEKDWFYRYMLAPQSFSHNTVMPSFWPGGKSVRKDLAGSAEDHIEALWQYLLDGRQAAMPHGVMREPLEIVVTSEAQMLRRSYPGIGKRGIGVGYPGGVNLAFDAEQLRLHAIWKGKFVDPGGVWTGQGSGNVQPKGKIIEFAKGPDLDDQQQPWVVDDGRPPNHRFKGYVLDAARRPTFRYTFDSVEAEDFFSEVIGDQDKATHLRRTVLLSAPEGRSKLRFRIASAEKISVVEQNLFAIGDRLKIRLVSGQTPQLVAEAGQGQRLEIQFDIVPGQKQELVFDYFWE
jgi:putative heme-binding domain-containing protein